MNHAITTHAANNPTGRTRTREAVREVGYACLPAVDVVDVVAATDHYCAKCDRRIFKGTPAIESRRVGDVDAHFTVRFCARACRAGTVRS